MAVLIIMLSVAVACVGFALMQRPPQEQKKRIAIRVEDDRRPRR